MKKTAIFLLVILITTGIAAAQDGFYFGAEANVQDLSEFKDTIFVTPYIGYKHQLFTILELAAELRAPMVFSPKFAADFELEPSAFLSFGIVYFGLAMPMDIYSTTGGTEAFSKVGFNFTLGAKFIPGLKVQATLYNNIRPMKWFNYLDVYGQYGKEDFYFGVCATLPLIKDGIKTIGIVITPDISFDINEKVNIYAKVPISGFGTNRSVNFGLIAGLKFSF